MNEDNLFVWELIVIGPPDTPYEGGFFKAHLSFPADFPNMPPKLVFKTKMWHPNIYEKEEAGGKVEAGEVCISILHPPGEDKFNEQESADERWRPIISVEAVILSVVSMLSDPNDESPANLDAAKEWREDRKSWKRKVRRCAEASLECC